MKNGLTPAYLTSLIPQQRTQPYALRTNSDIPTIRCNTQAYASSFLPLTIRQWNSLPTDTRNTPTLSEFKSKLNTKPNKSQYLFNIGIRKNQVNHARLRLGCSSLNYDIHRRNLIPSPLCACGSVETVSHYLMQCPRYQLMRNRFIKDLPCAPTLDNLLFGNDRLTPDANKVVFLRVQGYITATKRFVA